ncbi:IclR family transcriptional regulator C-terminal domain-containing protein [Brevibacterium sp. S111]|uniref:IclR family transcriptional regulator domain-containing protein n=1 Tax=Brevibacterium sp. S111 TaxID=2483795 RepID=UPI0023EF51BE|nr:IclR family transcriptional regulator C-terminal domain-containing protein [Brevibacterium sp. S111]
MAQRGSPLFVCSAYLGTRIPVSGFKWIPLSSYSELKVVLNAVRRRGFAFEDGDVTPDLTTLAVPVIDHMGWPAAAVAVTFGSTDLPE